jgi:hypothetical protein
VAANPQLSAQCDPSVYDLLAAVPKGAPPEIGYVMTECVDASAVGRHRMVGEKSRRPLGAAICLVVESNAAFAVAIRPSAFRRKFYGAGTMTLQCCSFFAFAATSRRAANATMLRLSRAAAVSRSQLELRSTAFFSDLALSRREPKKRLNLEGRQFTRELLQPQKRGLPGVLRILLNSGCDSISQITNSK